jgi:tripartite-type tricarboxylate transporter receptor subunit TctC
MYKTKPPGQLALTLLSLALGIGLTMNASISQAQNKGQKYPDRTVRMVVPLTTGSGADIAGRVVAKSLSETWKQSVIIENRPGAGGIIGTGVVVNA